MENIKGKIQKLTAEEIQQLDVHAAQRVMANNANLLVDIGNALFVTAKVHGQSGITLAQLKYYKDVITEQNRALKSVISNG